MMQKQQWIGLVVIALVAGAMFAGCVEDEEAPAAYPTSTPTSTPTPTPTSTLSEVTKPTLATISTPKPEPKYSSGSILETHTGIYEVIRNYSERRDAYETAIVEQKNGEWFYYYGINPERTSWVARGIIDEYEGLSVLEQVDSNEIKPRYVMGDIFTKSGTEDTAVVLLRYDDITDEYGVSAIHKILGDWYYSRQKNHPNRIVYEDRELVEKEFPIFIESIDPLYIKELPE